MEGVCTISPTVKGRPSKLFRDIKNHTGEQSSAAFLYGIATDPKITAQFTKKDFDRNDELLFKSFAEKFNLNDWIASRTELTDERRNQGVVNANGEPVVFDDPDELYDKIIAYNDSQDRFRMTMHWNAKKGGYVVDLKRTGTDNYDTNNIYKRNKALFDGYVRYLSVVLRHTPEFDDAFRKTFANFSNVKYFGDTVISLARSARDFKALRYLTDVKASLLLAFYGHTLLGQRVINTFGDNAVAALVETSKLTANDEDTMDPGLRSLLRNFLAQATSKAVPGTGLGKNFSESVFDRFGADSVAAQNFDNREFFGVPLDEITEIVKELKAKFMIDKNIKESSHGAIKMLSDVASRFVQISVRRMERMRRLGKRDDDFEKNMAKLKKDYEAGRYAESIAGMLLELESHLDDNEFSLNLSLELLDEGVGLTTLAGLNDVSKSILYTLKLGSAYGKLLEELEFWQGLEIDQQEVPEEILATVKDAALKQSRRLREQVKKARSKQFDILYAFYLPLWGGNDIKVDPEGKEHSLKDILNMLAEDPNILDRLIYSLNESNDEALGLLHQAVLDRHRARNEQLRDIDYYIRKVTDGLYRSGSGSEFIFERIDGELTGRIISPYGFAKYYDARREYIETLKEQDLDEEEFGRKLYEWEKLNTRHVSPFSGNINPEYDRRYRQSINKVVRELYGPDASPEDFEIDEIVVPADSYNDSHALDGLTEAQLQYYFDMLALKSVMQMGKPKYDTNFFYAPELQKNVVEMLKEVGSNPAKIGSVIANKFSMSSTREDEQYEETLSDVLHGNGLKRVLVDLDGTELMRLPLFFTHHLKDKSTMSLDFSRSMLAMSAASVNYDEMNKVLDTLLLTKDWLLTQREQDKTEGERKLVDLFRWGRDVFLQSVMKEENAESGLIVDFFERDVYGKAHKEEEITLFGENIKLDKAANWLTGFTSRTGLTVNILGSQANLLVGKLQMFIEGFAGEFFDLADMAYAEAKYFQLIMPYLLEYNSNNRSSFLGLLSDKFDVMEGFYQDLRRKGFETSVLGKILNNTNLFMLYGMGEHLLHNETMLAILHRVKVRRKNEDGTTGEEMSILNAYEESLEGTERNRRIDFKPYQWQIKQSDGTFKDFTEEDELKIYKQIDYCNKTMHGAFGDIEKGMAHRYAIGRLVMNFRQWMPGHYGRRYRSMHYDADLGEYRQGFYQSGFKFVVDTVNDLKRGRLAIATHWNELTEEERANLKRTIAETALLVLLTVQNISLGEYKDKRGSWAYRNLMYQTKRMLMETKASTPLSGFGPQGFIANMINILNSPVAAIATIQDIVTLMDLTKVFVTIEGGRYDGENLYLHNLKRRVPYVGQIMRQAKIGEEDYIFQVFE